MEKSSCSSTLTRSLGSPGAVLNSTMFRASQGAEQLPGALAVGVLDRVPVVAGADQLAHGPAAVALAAEHVQQHAVGHLEARNQPLRLGRP